MSVYFGGNRKLHTPSQAIAQAVSVTIQAGQSIHVGCCIGADQAVITSAVVLAPSFLIVFAIFNGLGQGACELSAISAVSAALSQGAQVNYMAGGALDLPLPPPG